MKKQNRFWAVVLALALCLALALPAVAAGSPKPRIYETFDLTGIPKDNDYHVLSGEVMLAAGTTVTVTGTWALPSASLWVGVFDETGSGRAVCLQQSGDTKSFTVSKEGYYTLQVSSPDFKISGGSLLVNW